MGNLIDTSQITLKDLAYAVDNAYDQRVRNAAMTLALIWMRAAVNEPVADVGQLHINSVGRSFSLRRQFFFTLVQGVVMGLALALMIIGIGIIIGDLTRPRDPVEVQQALERVQANPTIALFAIVIALVLLVLGGVLPNIVLTRIDRYLQKQINNHRKGEQAEQRVIEIMQHSLDGRWHVFRNLTLPGQYKADIDAILVGPSGVWALEVKNWAGQYRYQKDDWAQRRGGQWLALKKSPSKQAKRNALHLKHYLSKHAPDLFVKPTVIWANPTATLSLERPSIAVWTIEALADELRQLSSHQTTKHDEALTRIITDLNQLCDDQRRQLASETGLDAD